MAQSLRQQFTTIIDGEVTSKPADLAKYSRDASLFSVKPKLAVSPRHVADLQALVKFVAKSKEKLSLTARSGGTDMSGGPLTESVVVDMQHFNHIDPIQGVFVSAQPGVYYRDFEAATLKKNLLLPSYPASREIATIGGMVANNSGGEKTLAYGKTANFVHSLNVVLRDGREYSFSKLTASELAQKKKLSTLEGRIYTRIHQLIKDNYQLIQSARPKVTKNSAGYNLWDVWDKQAGTFDLTQLFTGSQGTLGIFTSIKFRLITPKPHSQLLIIFIKDFDQLADVVQRVLTYQPESFESFDDQTFKLALRFLPGLAKQMKAGSLFSLAWQFLPEIGLTLRGGVPKLLLMAEFTGESTQEVELRTRAAQTALKQYKVKTHLTTTAAEAQKYWVMRRESFNLLRHHFKKKRTAPFIDDIIVRPSQLPDFLPRLNAIMGEYDITFTIAGHIGDANFHIIPLMDLTKPKTKQIIKELSEKIYDLVLEFNGSITAEHNDGLIRSPWLEKMYGPEVYKLFVETKKIFDPKNIFNPGKKVGSSWDFALKHLIKD